MSIEVLEKFASESGNEEIVNAVNGIKESYKSNLDRITFLEKDLQKSIEKRDGIKNLVKSKLGVEELSEESIESVLSKYKSKDNNAELENMNKVIETLKGEKEALSSEYRNTVNGYKLEKQLASLGAFEDTESAKAYDIVLSEINKRVSFDDGGNVVFKDKEGITIRNTDGSPMSLSDMYKQIKDSEEYSFLFKTRRSKSGSGASGSSNGGQPSLKRSEMSYSEKGKFIEQFGQEAYLKLAK